MEHLALVLFFVSTIVVSNSLPVVTIPTVAERDAAAEIIKGVINDNNITNPGTTDLEFPLRAGFVRLAFHDCVSGSCDGCVNHTNNENKGLLPVSQKLDEKYDDVTLDISTSMSRADFYMLAAVVALDEAEEPGAPPARRFDGLGLLKFGRTSCATSPNGNEPASDFLSAFTGNFDGAGGVEEFFAQKFQFGRQDSVAILGAHTLGKCSFENSKFEGKWEVARNAHGARSDFLTNRYYRQIAGDWQQVQAQEPGTNQLGKLQWRRPQGAGGGARLMLNVDMSIAFDLTNNGTEDLIAQDGEVQSCVIDVVEDDRSIAEKVPGLQTCESTTTPCCPKSVVNQGGADPETNFFYRYANDFPRWIVEFRIAFFKMLGNDASGMTLPTSS